MINIFNPLFQTIPSPNTTHSHTFSKYLIHPNPFIICVQLLNGFALTASHLMIRWNNSEKKGYFRRCKLNGWREAETWNELSTAACMCRWLDWAVFKEIIHAASIIRATGLQHSAMQIQLQIVYMRINNMNLKRKNRCREITDIVVPSHVMTESMVPCDGEQDTASWSWCYGNTTCELVSEACVLHANPDWLLQSQVISQVCQQGYIRAPSMSVVWRNTYRHPWSMATWRSDYGYRHNLKFLPFELHHGGDAMGTKYHYARLNKCRLTGLVNCPGGLHTAHTWPRAR